ncbi:MAG TPA: hypothetical protein DCZ12_12110 [Gammaproteobacteria bacterium]|nr:hypothetical protein [Gammaproteobacteria bacterium]
MRFASLLVFVLFWPCAWADDWRYSESENPMDGAVSLMAMSPPAFPSDPLPYPYSDLSAGLVVHCLGGSTTVMLIFPRTRFPLLGTLSGGGIEADVRFKWDDLIEARLVREVGNDGDSLWLPNDDGVADLILQSGSLMVELPMYRHGNVYFNFSLSGAAEQVEKVVNGCF